MKNSSIFADVHAKNNFNSNTCSSHFYDYTLEADICKDRGLLNHRGLLHSCCNLFLAEHGRVALFTSTTYNFSFMPRTMNNCEQTNNSSLFSTNDARNASTIQAPFKKGKSSILISKSNRIEAGCYYGETSHFSIDTKTMEAVLRAFYFYSQNENPEILLTELNVIKNVFNEKGDSL